MCKLKRVCKDYTVNLQAHGNRGGEGGDDERGSHDEPRNNAEVEAAQEIEDEHRGTAKQELGARSHKGKVGNIESQLNGEEESIQESRGAEVLDEFHFEPLCSIHKI